MARLWLGFALCALLGTALLAPGLCAGEKPDDTVLLDSLRLLQSDIDRGRYAEGLELSRSALRRYPRYPDFRYGEALCLSGLHRYREATSILETLSERHPDRHDYRLKLAECLFLSGQVKEALMEWGRFFNHPDCSEEAYVRSVQALVATGQTARARTLIAEGLGRLPKPSRGLLGYQLDLERSAPAARAIVSQLIALDTENQFGYGSLDALYAAAGEATLYEESPLPPGGGITVPLDRVSDTRESTGLGQNTSGLYLYHETAQPILTCPVSINGSRTSWMMLDSGSPLVFLSPTFAEKLGLKPLSETQYSGLGTEGVQDSAWVLLEELKVGPFALRNVPAILLNRRSDFWSLTPGIIPLSLFRNHAVVFDPEAPSLGVFPSGTDPDLLVPEGVRVPSLWFKGCPFVQGKVEGSEEIFLLADTGSFCTLLGRTLLPEVQIVDTSSRMPNQFHSGLSGTFAYREAKNVRICLGRDCARLDNVQVTSLGLQYGIPLPGLLGRDFLERYRILFDPQHNRVVRQTTG